MKTLGADALVKKLLAYPELINRDVESLLRQQGRAICEHLANSTIPGPGFDEAKAEKFRNRVQADVQRVFADKSRPGSIFSAIRRLNPALAAAYWWGAVKKGDSAAAERILRKAGVPRGQSLSAYKAARTDRFGRVPKTFEPVSIATAPQVRALVRKQRALVGFAKAGWVAAANSLGGRSRRNVVREDGSRSTIEKFPPYIKALARRFPGIGGSSYTVTGSRHHLEVFTNVRHAKHALNMGLFTSGVSNAEQSFAKALAISLRTIQRKLFKAA